PVKIIIAPTRREKDGLAMSSRNKYLSSSQREQATILWRAIQYAKQRVGAKAFPAELLKKDLRKLIAGQSEARLDYVEFFNPETLQPVEKVKSGAQIALAVFIGKTRLIDNAKL
ncbi:MAG: pantoate--beta-alanine ligase, partial [Verrucomicrobiota bacterium]|nr:pantoate--beta-alanine ligase [Verrucomicrobiota bacterium]